MELDNFVQTLKPITKIYLAGNVICGLLLVMKIINPIHLILFLPKNPFHVI